MQNVCKQALRQLFGNRTKLTSFAVITDGYRNLTANVCCDAYPEHLFFKVEKSFAIPRTPSVPNNLLIIITYPFYFI